MQEILEQDFGTSKSNAKTKKPFIKILLIRFFKIDGEQKAINSGENLIQQMLKKFNFDRNLISQVVVKTSKCVKFSFLSKSFLENNIYFDILYLCYVGNIFPIISNRCLMYPNVHLNLCLQKRYLFLMTSLIGKCNFPSKGLSFFQKKAGKQCASQLKMVKYTCINKNYLYYEIFYFLFQSLLR